MTRVTIKFYYTCFDVDYINVVNVPHINGFCYIHVLKAIATYSLNICHGVDSNVYNCLGTKFLLYHASVRYLFGFEQQ